MLHLSRALRSLDRESFPKEDREIIVVNQDASERRAAEALAEQQGLRLIQRENLGFASGANAGAAQARGEYIAFLNPVAQYFSGSFEGVLDIFGEDESVGLVGATLRDTSGDEEAWSKGAFLTVGRLIAQNLALMPAFFPKHPVDWVSGGALLVRKELFQRLGGFSEDFFLYFEDMDLCARVGRAGFSVRSSGELSFSHIGGRSFASKRSQKEHFFDSQKKYVWKHRPLWERQVFFFLRAMKIW